MLPSLVRRALLRDIKDHAEEKVEKRIACFRCLERDALIVDAIVVHEFAYRIRVTYSRPGLVPRAGNHAFKDRVERDNILTQLKVCLLGNAGIKQPNFEVQTARVLWLVMNLSQLRGL